MEGCSCALALVLLVSRAPLRSLTPPGLTCTPEPCLTSAIRSHAPEATLTVYETLAVAEHSGCFFKDASGGYAQPSPSMELTAACTHALCER